MPQNKREINAHDFSGNKDTSLVPSITRALLLGNYQHLLHVKAANCTEGIPVQEVCTPQILIQSCQTDVLNR